MLKISPPKEQLKAGELVLIRCLFILLNIEIKKCKHISKGPKLRTCMQIKKEAVSRKKNKKTLKIYKVQLNRRLGRPCIMEM